MATIIGRLFEQNELQRYYQSDSSEFVAIYGRRRIGKTFLVREFFKDNFDFYLTGLANASMASQLINFQFSIKKAGFMDAPLTKNWLYAFQQLKELLEQSSHKRKVVFLDEMPWMDTVKSDFIPALEHFWNSWASGRSDIVLIVCGSSTSWMMNKLLNNKGGLHNRITQRLKIQPFTLLECKNYLQSLGISWDDYQITEGYMIFGGIPYYWSLLRKGLSLAQNADALFFRENGALRDEFKNLYAALFRNSVKYTQLVEVMSKKNKGFTRDELIESGKEKSGGGLSKMLEDLENCGFIRSYLSIGKKSRDRLYQLTDFYTLFYFHFLKSIPASADNYWCTMVDTPSHSSWSGYAFEQVSLAHIQQIRQSLGISGVHCKYATWRSKEAENGAQIDLLIDRNDSVINVCEMKYSIHPFAIDKNYAQNLRNKIGTFKEETKTPKSVFLTFITTFGVKPNEYSGMVQNEVKMIDLFN
jgi:uncharacterized protein